MIATKIAIALGVVLLGVACWMAVIGVSAASEGLLTVFALVALVAGGNYMAGRTSPHRRPPHPGPLPQEGPGEEHVQPHVQPHVRPDASDTGES